MHGLLLQSSMQHSSNLPGRRSINQVKSVEKCHERGDAITGGKLDHQASPSCHQDRQWWGGGGFVVSELSQHFAEPTEEDWNTIKHMFRYLKGTAEQKLCYKRSDTERLRVHNDSDWA